MRFGMGLAAAALLAMAGCAGIGAQQTVVKGVGTGDLLKLRAGPGLGFNVIVGLPNGTRLNRQKCVTESGQLWCRVTLADKPNVSGYVSADYLGM